MADQFVVLPAHLLAGIVRHPDAYAAADDAARAVEKDKTPRTVVQVFSEVKACPEPKLHIVQIAEVPGND